MESLAQPVPGVFRQVVDVLGTGLFQGGQLHSFGEDGPVRDEIGVYAGVGLSVGMVGAEERFGVFCRQGLDTVDHLAAGVHAVARYALGVLVREPVAHGEQDRG